MIRAGRVAAVLLVAGCSSLGEGDTVVAIELRTPSPAVVEQDDTLRLQARALNADGDSVAATITWRSADTTLTVVGADLLTTHLASGSGRVQAGVGSLRSELVNYTIRRRSDALDLGAIALDTTTVDTLVVPSGDTASADLVARVVSAGSDTVGVAGTSIRYRVADADTALARGQVRFQGGELEQRVTTGASGTPVSPVTLRIVPGGSPPDSIRIEALAARPSGQAVPGSGHRFTIIFQ